MSTRTSPRKTRSPAAAPGFVTVPIAEYEALVARARAAGPRATIPHEVVSLMVDGYSAARAWREHLCLTQTEVAARMGISQSALAQIEAATQPRKATRARLAAALGISVEQLPVR